MKILLARNVEGRLQFVVTCDICQKIKIDTHPHHAFLRPSPIAERPHQTVTMDLITGLPKSNGFDAIIVAVDKWLKHAQGFPCLTKTFKSGAASLFFRHVVCRFGMPQVIITDRDGQWMNDFFMDLVSHLGTEMFFSTARHPQTDGQTEQQNQRLKAALRAYANDLRNNWSDLLAPLFHVYNSTPHASSKFSFHFCSTDLNPTVQLITWQE